MDVIHCVRGVVEWLRLAVREQAVRSRFVALLAAVTLGVLCVRS